MFCFFLLQTNLKIFRNFSFFSRNIQYHKALLTRTASIRGYFGVYSTPNDSKNENSKYTILFAYLNIGTGNPWAGQRRAKLWLIVRKNKPLLLSVENAGPFAPTGSRYKWNCNKINYKHSLTHRNIGTGNPCAGHKRAKPWPSDRKKELLLSSVENIGLLAPTGSVLEQRFLIRLVNFQTLPDQFILLKPVC